MRAYELSKLSPVEELKNKLPQLKDHNFSTIDKLMKDISHKHGLDPHGKKLHVMFISKYGHSPDHWIRKIKNKLSEYNIDENFIGMDPQGVAENNKNYPPKIQQVVDRYKQLEREEKMLDLSDPREKQRNYHIQKELAQLEYDLMKMNAGSAIDETRLNEGVDTAEDVDQIKKFIKWSYETLNMQKPYPRIQLSKDTKKAQAGHHTGLHVGNNIWVYVANRNMIDIFRTIFHELTHHRQMQLNMIKDGDSYPGSPIEMLADMAAGKYIKIYGKKHPEMFQ